MGRKRDACRKKIQKLYALLVPKFEPTELKTIAKLAVSRIAILKKKPQCRLDVARSDIIQLLNDGLHEAALVRADLVIKEQNILDVYVMVDGYCQLLIQRANLIEKEKKCPDELREAVTSLIYASLRCSEFPELQKIRAILTARYGKDFANGAIRLRTDCGVCNRMIRKLSTQQAGLETRMKVLQDIATENDIVLKLDDSSPVLNENQLSSGGIEKNSSDLDNEDMSSSQSRKGKKKYRNAEDAAQDAYEAADYARYAARAAVELFSRGKPSGSHSPNSRPRKVLDSKEKFQMEYEKSHESETESEPEPQHEPKVTIVEKKDETSKDNMKQQAGDTTVFDENDNDLGLENTEPPYDDGPKNAATRFD